MTKPRALLVTAIALELLFVALCIVPLPQQINPFDGIRQLLLFSSTVALSALGLYGFLLTRRGYMLREVSICLLLMLPIHIVAAGAQKELIWLPIAFGFCSIAISTSLAWRNA